MEQNVLASLADLTKQRDLIAIRSKLLASLIEVTACAWIVLCRFNNDAAKPSIDILNRIPNPHSNKSEQYFSNEIFENIDLFDQCVKQGNPNWVLNYEPYQAIIFELNDCNGEDTKEFIVLFDSEVNGRSESHVLTILSLFQNFVSLVIENSQDALTMLLNRGSFDRDLELVVGNRRKGLVQTKNSYLAMLDLDHFKKINDNYGHLYGDEVLLLFASLMKSSFRESDLLYRYGGEEFSIIIADIEEKDIKTLMTKLCNKVSEYDFPQVGQVTVSIGVSVISTNCLPSSLVDLADQALYYSKKNGRNQVTFYDDVVDQLGTKEIATGEAELF